MRYVTSPTDLSRLLHARYLELRDAEDGQGAVEYVGIVIVVVAIVVAVSGQAGTIGKAIGDGLKKIVEDFVGS